VKARLGEGSGMRESSAVRAVLCEGSTARVATNNQSVTFVALCMLYATVGLQRSAFSDVATVEPCNAYRSIATTSLRACSE
jgi:hypothetical protein